MKKSIFLISVGILNLLHGSFHIIQFIQSMIFVVYSTHNIENEHSLIDDMMHSPVFALIMGAIGILTLIIGIKDYKHHKKCHDHVNLK